MLGYWPGIIPSSRPNPNTAGVMALMPVNMPWEARCQQNVE
ncbi:MAG: hypothetical protein ACOX6S_09035 [Clostridia bacterium]